MSDNPAVVEGMRLADEYAVRNREQDEGDPGTSWDLVVAAREVLLEHLRRQSNLLLRARKAIYDMSNDRELMTDWDAELLNEIDSNDLGSAR